MPHPSEHEAAGRPLSVDEAEVLAEAMRAFGAGSRLRLLWAMLGGERTVEELVESTGIAPSATSHQLRLLRHGRLVADLLGAIRHHHEHAQPSEELTPPRMEEREQARS